MSHCQDDICRPFKTPPVYVPRMTLCNRFVPRSGACVLNRIFETLAADNRATGTVMIDAIHYRHWLPTGRRGLLGGWGGIR